MSNFIYTAGLNNVGSYQVSGMPFATGTLNPSIYGSAGLKIEFPFVTSWIEVINHDTSNNVKVAFSSEGLQGNNFFKIIRNNAGRGDPTSHKLDLKITELYLGGNATNVDIVAGLTNIPVGRVTAASPSGSNWSGSIGVG